MAKYKKRKDGRYAKQVTVSYKNGNPVKKTVYGHTIAELEKNYRDLMFVVDRGTVIENGSMKFEELRKEWYRIRKQGKIRQNTVNSMSAYIKHMKPLDELKVKDIKRYNIECLLGEIQEQGKICTSNEVLKLLRILFNYAIEIDVIVKNPCMGLSVKYDSKKKRTLTEEEKNIIETVDMPIKDKMILYMLRYTGIRRGELFALTKADIDKENMVIHINKTLIDNNGKPYIQNEAKTEAGDRIVPIFLKLAKPLFEYIETVDGVLFTNKNGALMKCASMHWMIKHFAKKYGFGPDLTMHCFRYNFISECYLAGVDIKRVQSWVGHDDIQTTLNIYTKLSKSQISDGGTMDAFYGSQTEVKHQSASKLKTLKHS